MKYLLFLFISFFFISCAENKDNQEIPDPTTYYLTYNETSTQIEGEVTFDMGSILSNHIITLTNFTPKVGECSINTISGIVSPDPITFTSLNTKKLANISVDFASPCTEQTLKLQAEETDVSTLNGKIVSHTKEVTYSFTLSKTTTTAVSNYTPVLKKSEITIKTNKQNETVIVSVYDDKNRPATEGTVSVIYPSSVKEGVDVGNFSPTEVEVKEGIATFNYTAPNDINTSGDASTEFKFYYNESIANSVALEVNFKPDPNQIVNKRYSINLKPENDEYIMQLEDIKPFSVTVVDDEGTPVAGDKINTISVSLANEFIATLAKSDGVEGKSFIYTKENSITLTLKSSTKSGLVAIDVDASFMDVNGNPQDINGTLNLVVESGPPTAISISYVDTAQDKERAKFIERFAISVTDKYFNPVNTNPGVSVGAIVGYAHYESPLPDESNRIFMNDRYGLLATLTSEKLAIQQDIDTLNSDIDLNNDILVTFGDGYRYPASGGWLFKSFDKNSLFLEVNQYMETETTQLGYAVGHNYRQDQCRLGDEWVGQTTLQEGVVRLDDKGTAIAELSYDYYLVGKDILFYTNIIGHDNKLSKDLRVGEAKKHTLRGHGLEFGEITTVIAADGNSASRRFFVWLKDTGEGDASATPYRNANFVFEKVRQGAGGIIDQIQSNQYSCDYEGHAYIYYNIVADNVEEQFSITIANPTIINEF